MTDHEVLESWTDGAARRAIVDFLLLVDRAGSSLTWAAAAVATRLG